MKISELRKLLKRYKEEYGDVHIGLKVCSSEGIHIKQIKGISMSGFEGHNLSDGEDDE